jgi:dUTP pyrophosphatase
LRLLTYEKGMVSMRDRTVAGIGYATVDRDVEGGHRKTPVPYLPKIVVERIHPDAVIPTYASEGDSGMDVYAVEDMLLAPGETALCATGLKFAIPLHPFHELGYRWEAQARPRSGVSVKTAIRVANAPGTIDNFYRGEVKVILTNTAQPGYELERERDEVTGAIASINIEPIRTDYAFGMDGKQVFTGNFSSNIRGTALIRKGDRVAQMVFAEVIRPLEIVEGTVDADTDRGAGGFGHTGK